MTPVKWKIIPGGFQSKFRETAQGDSKLLATKIQKVSTIAMI